MDKRVINVQDGGIFGFTSEIQKNISKINKELKIELGTIQKGKAFTFQKKFKALVDEEKADITDIINSNFSEKKDFYRIIKQWADLFGQGQIKTYIARDAKLEKGEPAFKFGFEVFIENLNKVFGEPTGNSEMDDGTMRIYDDKDFYDMLYPNIKEYIKTKEKNSPKTGPSDAKVFSIFQMIDIITDNFNIIKKDGTILQNLNICELIVNILVHAAKSTPAEYMIILNQIFEKMPNFRNTCSINQLITLTLVWLKTDAAIGKEAQSQRFKKEHYHLILTKLLYFHDLYVIFPSLVNNDTMKQILYGNKNENGKIVNWMKYIRQHMRDQKRSDKDEEVEKTNYPKIFMEAFEKLIYHTYPFLFGTAAANMQEKSGFFSNLKNMFSAKKIDVYFDKIKKGLYREIINWLTFLNIGDYLRLLEKILEVFPDLMTHRTFLTSAEFNEKILSIVTPPPINKKTGKPVFKKEFSYVKRDLENLGKLLETRRKPGNNIEKLYENEHFNKLFYSYLKKMVELNVKDAAKEGFVLVEDSSTNNFEELDTTFKVNLLDSIKSETSINISNMGLLEQFLDKRYDIISIGSVLPKKITGNDPITNAQLIAYTKDIPVGQNTPFQNENGKKKFLNILLSIIDTFKQNNSDGFKSTILTINNITIDPSQALSWYTMSEFYTVGTDTDIDKKTVSTSEDSYTNLDKAQRRNMSDLSGDVVSDEVSQILQENLPEVSLLSAEIANLLKIIDDQGKQLKSTDNMIDKLIEDENAILEHVSNKVEDINSIISTNNLDTSVKKQKSIKKKKIVTVEIETISKGGSKKQKKQIIGKYKISNHKSTYLYRQEEIFFYINENKKRKKVDTNSLKIIY